MSCYRRQRLHSRVQLRPSLRLSRCPLSQFVIPDGQGDADKLRVIDSLEREEGEDGQPFICAPRAQPSVCIVSVSLEHRT